ncbi:DUF3089 domain-containing protein [Novosphingobium sp. KCTC 2891]|uniref:DUF3089 domain-containing protein n=1 Tax=Novosphingobium sp. KCTC 2891 TaxID=2989730 RepID=UPI002221B70B|nr:DUF3089 domain-containing protein [Novosphingobium sp. KCTC 2891]MCW1382560.1 DUF3089 domain-containing protein [Novosphingobium sp. KCTC 2891]
MARKFLYFIAILIVLALAALLVLRFWSKELTRFAFVPRGAFEQQAPLPADYYGQPDAWISRPGVKDDPAQYVPEGAARGRVGQAWVFFVHPTSYLARNHWNGPLDDADSRFRAGLFVRGMASAFNAAGPVWVPRYRQAAFGAFLTDRPEAQRALELAYGDVSLAFDAFVAQVPQGAPIVLAGHSQGALQLMRLVRDRVKGTPLAARVVAVYAIGWPVSAGHDLPAMGMPACDSPQRTGCVASWLSFAEPADPSMMIDAWRAQAGLDGQPRKSEPTLCFNPLTGSTGSTAAAAANLGTMVPAADLTEGKLVPRAVPARCDARTGLLMVGDPPQMGPFVLPGNNYHVYDVPLFWANLRADVARREQAWQRAQAGADRK